MKLQKGGKMSTKKDHHILKSAMHVLNDIAIKMINDQKTIKFLFVIEIKFSPLQEYFRIMNEKVR